MPRCTARLANPCHIWGLLTLIDSLWSNFHRSVGASARCSGMEWVKDVQVGDLGIIISEAATACHIAKLCWLVDISLLFQFSKAWRSPKTFHLFQLFAKIIGFFSRLLRWNESIVETWRAITMNFWLWNMLFLHRVPLTQRINWGR